MDLLQEGKLLTTVWNLMYRTVNGRPEAVVKQSEQHLLYIYDGPIPDLSYVWISF